MNDKTGDIMSKLEETNLMLTTIMEMYKGKGGFADTDIREAAKTTALLDIAKSLAIIVDNTSNRSE